MKKNIMKILVFMIILIIILEILSLILIPKKNTKEAGMKDAQALSILGEDENTIDVIMYGDSEAFASTIPMQLWEEYGFTSYICATAGQSVSDTCKIAYQTLKKQKPKLVILEADNIFITTSSTVPLARVLNLVMPITEYHNRWKNLNKDDFFFKTDYTEKDSNKGYYYIEETDPVEDKEYMTYTDEVENVPFQNKILVKFLKKYVESKGAKLAIVSVPSLKNWNYKKHNGMKEFAEKENIEFLDLNVLKDEVNIDWQTETGDKGDHVNYKGAVKVTSYLGKWLKEKNILQDRRNDVNY